MGKSIMVVVVYAALGCGAGSILGSFPRGTLIGGAIGALVGVLTRRDQAAREKELRGVADQLGFQYVGDDAHREVPRFALFSHVGGNPGLFHGIRGQRDGATVFYFDSRLGINSSSIRYRPAVIVCAPDLQLPHFVAHPSFRGPGAMYNVKLGVRLELPGNPKTHASAADAAGATVFTPEVLDALARDPEWFVEGMGAWLIALRWQFTTVFRFPYQARLLPASAVPRHLDEALGLLRLFRTRRAA